MLNGEVNSLPYILPLAAMSLKVSSWTYALHYVYYSSQFSSSPFFSLSNHLYADDAQLFLSFQQLTLTQVLLTIRMLFN